MARGHADAASARQDLHRRGAWLGGGSGRRALRPERAGRHGQRAQAGVAGPDDRRPRGASHRTCGGGHRRRRARGGGASARGRGAEGSAARDRCPEVAAGRRARHAFGGAAGLRGPGELPAHPHRRPSGGQACFRCQAPALLQRQVGSMSIVDFRVRLATELRPAVDLPAEYVNRYDAVLGLEERRDMSLETLVAEMDAAGVSHAVVHAEYEYGDPADELNEAVGGLVGRMPDRFSGYGTVSLAPLRVMRAVAQVARSAELGLRGINIQPSFFGIPIDHAQLYPVYAKASELGLAVGTHTGVNYTSHLPIKHDHPLQLDQVACDFPDLVLIACHAGWPWGAELVAVARKHPHVYLEFGGLAPKYVGAAGTGWEEVFRFMNSLLSRQVLFATDWPVFPMLRALVEWRGLNLKPEVLDALLGGNANRLLGRR